MNMPVTTITASPSVLLLPRLEGVIKTGRGWRSRCPAHDGKSASLAITEGDNGTLLLHCFAGCQVHDVLAAVGLQVGDLFPERIRDTTPEGRRAAQQAFKQTAWGAALGVVSREAKVISIAAHDLAAGLVLNDTDADRLALAIDRIDTAREVLV
ncbi:hypothetical protein [Rhodanobacter sp. OK091]|uniref:hypothetical protein n=1 Tax=Rhodanobacter sp. OK091 TaxID=1881037 RepID=UPI0009236011|nr:hypothetical protein [Rhodanobacter sp. OK091]SHM18716.1 hypothetical protein SAMN05428972_2761 [Rhodanobacter sp. OK091]